MHTCRYASMIVLVARMEKMRNTQNNLKVGITTEI
jgi:hypothetical protein